MRKVGLKSLTPSPKTPLQVELGKNIYIVFQGLEFPSQGLVAAKHKESFNQANGLEIIYQTA